MPVEIRVPQMGESVVEATIARWIKKPGDTVAEGEAVVELETDKVNVEVAAEASGVLQSQAFKEGDTVKIDDVLGTLGDAAAPAAVAASVPAAAAPAAQPSAASPIARKVAEENNIDLSTLKGSGPNGRIVRDDVAGQIGSKPEAAPVAPVAQPVAPRAVEAAPVAAPSANAGREERVKMTRRRQTIAARLVEAQHTAAMLTTFNEIDMTAVMDVRKRRKDSFKERNGVNLGFMSFFTKASVGALKAFPYLNAEIQGTEIVLKHYYDMGVAVSTNEGLVVPVVRDADRLTFAEIEKAIAAVAVKARDGKLALSDLQGGTFTITNGGVFGSLMSTPILNAPQVAILGLHKIQERPVAINGEVVIRPMMYVALSYDHRIVDGSEAVRFLVKVKELIEDPESLLLEG